MSAITGLTWREIGDRVYVRRHSSFDVNVGLVVAAGNCLVIDTLSTHEQARELIESIRTITAEPWAVVNTHAHFDHCFGNAMFRPAPIWGHSRTARAIREFGATQRQTAREFAGEQGDPRLVREVDSVRLDPPDRTIDRTTNLELGDRTVVLHFLGRGHTDGDLVVEVPDTEVLFVGDLIEEGAPPSFEDSFPLDWPGTASALLPLASGVVVPGHGDIVDRKFVENQASDLTRVAEHARTVHAAGRTAETGWAELPFPENAARIALQRAHWQLDNTL
jgi:glyoxylase-like metal-dependent hydrolase (beta-lactamase superfamily II)